MKNEEVAASAAPEPESELALRVNAVRVFVSDLVKAAVFYSEKVGLPQKAISDEWIVFGLGNVDLIVETADKDDLHGRALIGRFLGVSLTSPDMLSAFDVLSERGVEFLAPPAKQDWGGYLAHFYDPDRNIISLVG